MKKVLFRFLSLSLIGAAVAISQPAHAAKVRVVTTLTDMADFAREIGG